MSSPFFVCAVVASKIHCPQALLVGAEFFGWFDILGDPLIPLVFCRIRVELGANQLTPFGRAGDFPDPAPATSCRVPPGCDKNTAVVVAQRDGCRIAHCPGGNFHSYLLPRS